MKRIGSILFLLLFYILSVHLSAQDISIEASVSETEAAIGERINYSITVSGKAGNLPKPQLPSFADFQIYNAGTSSSFQFINGVISSSVIYNYAVIPQKEGSFTIGSAKIEYQGKVYQSQPITIKVVKERGKKPGKTPTIEEQVFRQREQSEVFVKALINKSTAYINEPVNFQYKLYINNATLSHNYGKESPPFTGFWVEDIPPPQKIKSSIETLNSKKYRTLVLERKILFPTSSGVHRIGKTKFQFIIDDLFSLFSKRVIREANDLSIRVLPLPDKGKPEDFKGCVGHFAISTKLSTTKIKQNQPFVLKVVISGTGNIKTINEPLPPTWEKVKLYDSSSSININRTPAGLTGSKAFEYILIPDTAGEIRINPFRFSYFNYMKKKYMTLKTSLIKLYAQPGPASIAITRSGSTPVEMVGKDIRFIKEVSRIKNEGAYIHRKKGFFLLVLFPFFALGFIYYYSRYKLKMETDIKFARASRAFKLARKRIMDIEKKLRSHHLIDIAYDFEKLLTGYIGDKLNIPSASLVIDEIKKSLEKENVPLALVTSITDLYHKANMIRYAPAKAGKTEYETLLNEIKGLFNDMESSSLKERSLRETIIEWFNKIKPIIFFIMLLWFSPLLSEPSPVNELFQQGNKNYKTGNYEKAIGIYESIKQKGVKNGYLYYNLGNAYFKNSQLGEAILNYERARLYLPRDRDVKFNLEFAENLKVDSIQEMEYNPFTKIIFFVYDLFNVNILFIFVFILSWLLVAIFAVKWLVKNVLYRSLAARIFPTIVMAFLFFLILFMIKVYHAQNHIDSVVLASESEVRSGPGQDFTVIFTLHEGTKVRERNYSQRWTQISLPNGFNGWIDSKDIERIEK
ncbi:MAG: BatD family protein [Spirochaetes bacterium]|nr:BatD family protein [Spirochaetota bacterium]